jgi:hypothetical protein
MLDLALQFLIGELNSHLLARTNSDAVEVKMSKVVDEAGKYAFPEGSICAAIVNIEEDRIFKSQLPEYEYINGQQVAFEPELKLNLYVLFGANFKLYDQALKFLSYILTYFQSHPSFKSEEYPALDPRIEKLIVELQSLNFEQLNQVWAFIGGKQLPSVIYKLRLIVLQDSVQSTIGPPITIIDSTVHNQ